MSQTICRRRFGRVLTALAGALSLAAGASAQWILIDDFNAGHDDAWTHVDLLEGTPWGPTIYDASTFEYHISSTESIPPQGYYLWTGAFWTESADNWRYSEGIVRAKIRMDTAATHPFLGMRVDDELQNGYAFACNYAYDYIRILLMQNGLLFVLDEGYFVLDEGKNYILEAGAIGPNLSLKIWEEGDPIPPDPQLTAVHSTFAVGRLGVAVCVLLGGPAGYLSGYFDDVWFLPAPACPGDIDGDGDTDHSDLGELLAAWCTQEGDPNWNPDADLDGDGHVGHGDLGILLADWGCGT